MTLCRSEGSSADGRLSLLLLFLGGSLSAASCEEAALPAPTTVVPAPPPPAATPTTTVRVTPASGFVEVGDTLRLSATVTGATGQPVENPAITWTASDDLAWVSPGGLVTGASPGQVTVTATSEGAEGTATLAVTASPITEVLLEVRGQHPVVALAGAIVTSSGLADVGAVGNRAVGSPVPVTRYDRWHLGSITKSMTSTLVGVLVEAGALDWTTTLEETFPDLASTFHPELRAVPIEAMLAHRGGFTNDIGQFAIWRTLWTSTDPLQEQRRAFAAEVAAQAPEFPPLKTFHYSNVGYMVAGSMIESATGETWETLMQRHVFSPLGMTDTGFGPPGLEGAMDQPRGHRSEEGGALTPLEPNRNADNPPALGPAGTVHATMQDLALYIATHLKGGQGMEDLLQPGTMQRLHTPADGFDYAAGWLVVERQWAGGRTLVHDGSNTLWYAVVWMAPERDFAVLAATNQAGDLAGEATDLAAWNLIRLHLGS